MGKISSTLFFAVTDSMKSSSFALAEIVFFSAVYARFSDGYEFFSYDKK